MPASTTFTVALVLTAANHMSGAITQAGTTSKAQRNPLFYRGPAVLAAVIGAELSNRTPVILYHHQPNSGYENWGPLHQ